MSARGAALCFAVIASCSRDREPERTAAVPSSSSSAAALPSPSAPPGRPLELLYLPEAEETLPPPFGDARRAPGAPVRSSGRCPADMVDVRGAFCIDRYESSLVDAASGRTLSPYFHPTLAQTRVGVQRYGGASNARNAPPFPDPPAFQLESEFTPAARSLPGVVPNGYLSGDVADVACRAAGKRLCTLEEWRTACRGERNDQFPYGDSYQAGTCNVFREAHPAVVLHGNASIHHLDPRLNRVSGESGPLLRATGTSAGCRSPWGPDGVWDLVGNLDEWVADGSFAGGFYARATKEGCDARISSHPPSYFDYSTGSRCCL